MTTADGTQRAECTVVVDGVISNLPFIEAVEKQLNIGWTKETDGTVKLTPENLEKILAVKEMNIGSKSLTDITGIEWFSNLTYLSCSNNQLTTLDVSHNTALTELYCYNNQLTTLDVSHNTALTYLDCSNNQLTTLDVSHNIDLRNLHCSNNQLTTLDVSKNTDLKYLSCSNNQLTTLDVSKNTALTDLSCSNNQLTTLDVSHNTALTYLVCYNNQLTTLDVSHNTALTDLSCSGQKNETGGSQTLTLKLTQSQHNNNTDWYSESDVTPQVVGSPTQL